MFESVQAFDLSVLWSMHSIHSPIIVWLAWAVSTVAWKGWLWWLLIIGSWLRGNRNFSAHLASALLIATVAGLPLKSVIARARPDLYASQQLNIPMPELLSTAHSFPSGHTLLAAAFAFVVVYYYRDYRSWLAFAFVGLVGAARVYQLMHWPTDVVGSIALGALASLAAKYVIQAPQIQRFIQPAKQGSISTEFLVPHAELPAKESADAVSSRR